MLTVILAGIQKELIDAWSKAFEGHDNIEIYAGSIFEVECDAIVSPANSFGFMDGGIDYQMSQYFGWHVQERLQQKIWEKHHGELLVGTAEIIHTDHPHIPYVISAPTMRVPMILADTVNVYLATRAVFLLIKYGVFDDGSSLASKIHRVAFPGMGTGVGQVSPEICARQMHSAFKDVIEETYRFPRIWAEAQRRHQLLYGDRSRDLQYQAISDIAKTLGSLKEELLKYKHSRAK